MDTKQTTDPRTRYQDLLAASADRDLTSAEHAEMASLTADLSQPDDDPRIAYLRYAIDTLRDALKASTSLETLGYNTRHAEGCPGEIDETGITRLRYVREAGKLNRQIKKALEETKGLGSYT
jgi:hypothetical protein